MRLLGRERRLGLLLAQLGKQRPVDGALPRRLRLHALRQRALRHHLGGGVLERKGRGVQRKCQLLQAACVATMSGIYSCLVLIKSLRCTVQREC